MRCFILLKLALLFYLNLVADAVQIGQSSNNVAIIYRGGDRSELNDWVTKIEAKNRLRDRVAKLEKSNDPPKIIERPKRPVSTTHSAFYGPPTGCFDLSRLGYTLNGYYLVSDKESQSVGIQYTQVEVVQCRFRKPSGEIQTSAEDFERRVGYIPMYEEFEIAAKSAAKKSDSIIFMLAYIPVGNHLKMCLVAADRKKDDGSNQYLGSYLAQIPCQAITEEYEQWTRRGSYICSIRSRNCFTMPLVEAQTEAVDLSLMPYREISLDSFQEWKIMDTTKKDGSIQIALPDTKADLFWNFDSATDDSASNKTASASKAKKATVSVLACEESSEQRFCFEPAVNIESNKGKSCNIEYAARYDERKSKKSKKNNRYYK